MIFNVFIQFGILVLNGVAVFLPEGHLTAEATGAMADFFSGLAKLNAILDLNPFFQVITIMFGIEFYLFAFRGAVWTLKKLHIFG
jgi:hypothetical protein